MFTPIDNPYQDLQTRATQRLLIQFKNSPVLGQVLYAVISEVQVLSDAITDVMSSFIPANLQGEQEDFVGAIVGVNRNVGYAALNIQIISEDGLNVVLTEDGQDIFMDGGPSINEYMLSDYLYLRAIQAKIFTNFVRDCSTGDITTFFQLAYNINVIPITVGPMVIILMFPAETDQTIINVSTQNSASQISDLPFYPPYAATLEVYTQQYQPFAFEDGTPWITEDGQSLYTEGVEPFTLGGVIYE